MRLKSKNRKHRAGLALLMGAVFLFSVGRCGKRFEPICNAAMMTEVRAIEAEYSAFQTRIQTDSPDWFEELSRGEAAKELLERGSKASYSSDWDLYTHCSETGEKETFSPYMRVYTIRSSLFEYQASHP